MSSPPDFGEYFRALWGREPFPWQHMLAERVATGEWPRALDVPTASGKTACIDIAVYALAAQAQRPLAERTAPRRVWFVVDRRIVVDEAFERASRIADKLARATTGPLKEVADRLRDLSGTERPLAVGRLRGGILRDDGWARIPSQPAVITSTVDQVGSRLLFRGYGHSILAAPIFAGLAANDSLIILDEAHCAVPFMQTLEAIRRYRGPEWAEETLPSPFGFVVMSATPPRGLPAVSVFPGCLRDRALDHPELRRRLRTSKPAELVLLSHRGDAEADPLVTDAVQRAAGFVRDGRRRVAVMVNRVRTAMEAAAGLQSALAEQAHVVLFTGRIRPFERDGVVERWSRYLRANAPEEPERPIVVVATQCLEVGADFSFDALVTECASLDALRQRFGRLARLGSDEAAPAAILIRQDDIEPSEPDPVYGLALANTWKWLQEQATTDAQGRLVIDMGVEALEGRVREVEDLRSLLAPSPDAPILLPAHLDLLCQTAPPAHPEPDVALYLHGRPGPPEVSVVWRSDLPAADTRQWVEIVALCPPVSGEMLQAPLWRVRAWLAEEPAVDDSPDVEGLGEEQEQARGRIRPCVVWRGRDRSRVVERAAEIQPGDVLVVPAAYGIEPLGQATGEQGLGSDRLDLWEAARVAAGHPAAVRLNQAVLAPWLDCPPLKDLVGLATAPAPDREEIDDAIQAVLEYRQQGEESPPSPPEWWLELLDKARGGRMVEHPAGGLILVARPPGVAQPSQTSSPTTTIWRPLGTARCLLSSTRSWCGGLRRRSRNGASRGASTARSPSRPSGTTRGSSTHASRSFSARGTKWPRPPPQSPSRSQPPYPCLLPGAARSAKPAAYRKASATRCSRLSSPDGSPSSLRTTRWQTSSCTLSAVTTAMAGPSRRWRWIPRLRRSPGLCRGPRSGSIPRPGRPLPQHTASIRGSQNASGA